MTGRGEYVCIAWADGRQLIVNAELQQDLRPALL